MCLDPTTIALASLALSTAGSVASYEQQRQGASAQADALTKANDLEQADLTRQSEQQQRATAAEMNERARQAQKDMALFDVVTGEFGGGNSASRARGVSTIQNSENLATIGQNAKNRQGEIASQSMAANVQTNGRLSTIAQPSMLGTALTIGSAAVGYQTDMTRIDSIDKLRSKGIKVDRHNWNYRGTTLPNSLRGGR